MRLKVEQLAAHLERGPLAPIFLLSGEEPLQLAEAADAIRAAARRQGYGERQVLDADTGFDWDALLAAANSLSLFAERRIIELRLTGSKLGDGGAKALTGYAERPPEENLLLVICGKLDKRQQQSKWFQAVERRGVFVPVWPVERGALPGWIGQRMRGRGLKPTPAAAALVAERVEGNLLAAAQEVEKLLLLCGPGDLDAEAVRAAVADSSRYDIFEFADACLAGDAVRVVRIFEGLRGEGVEPVLVLWALAREIRALAAMAHRLSCGEGIEAAMGAQGVWEKRKPLVRAALKRHGARRWRGLLATAARIDRVVKRAEAGDPWSELLQLALAVSGVRWH